MATVPDVRFVEITREAGIAFKPRQRRAGREAPARDDGLGRGLLRLRRRRRPRPLPRQLRPPGPTPRPSRPPTQALYRNDGKGHFEDVTKEAGLDRTFFGMGVAVGDYDNDGDPDLYVTAPRRQLPLPERRQGPLRRRDRRGQRPGGRRLVHQRRVLRHGERRRPRPVRLLLRRLVRPRPTRRSRPSSSGKGKAYDPPAAYNGSHCLLLRNDGGKFVDVSEASGIQVRSPDKQAPIAKSLGVAPYDVDGDGLVDLAVANDTVVNFFFHNLGGGKFEEIGLTTGIAFDQAGSTRAAMGIDWGDFKNDGTLGLAIGNFANEMTALYVTEDPPSLLVLRPGQHLRARGPDPAPAQVRPLLLRLRPRRPARPALGQRPPGERHRPDPGVGDLRPVGPALLEHRARSAASCSSWSARGQGRARPVPADRRPGEQPTPTSTATATSTSSSPRTAARPTSSGTTAGTGTTGSGSTSRGRASNRDAIGARVEVEAGGVASRRQLFLAKGYLSSVEHPLTFGLGRADKADKVTIVWPSGAKTELKDLAAGQDPQDRRAGRPRLQERSGARRIL